MLLYDDIEMHELHMQFDEPSGPIQQPSQSENEDSNSNFLFDQTERKDMDPNATEMSNNVDLQSLRENEIKLKAARTRIETLENQMGVIQDENERLTKTKMDLLDKTSQQIEDMRDELQNMCTQLRQKEATIKQLIHINKEGYDPDLDEQKSNLGDTNIRSSWSNPLGIGSSIKNGINYITFGRSKYSTPVHTLGDTKKQKIDLAISTSQEIERLRSIIRVLSTAQSNTQNGIINTPNTNQQRNGLMSYNNPGGIGGVVGGGRLN